MGRKRERRTEPASQPKAAGRSRPIRSTYPPLNVLTPAQVERLHQASLTILSKTGVDFKLDSALRVFKAAGARVKDERVFLDPALIETALRTAPATYQLHARNPDNTIAVGGRTTVVMPGGGPAYVHDLENQRRPGTLADVENFARLSQMSSEVHVMARKAVEAQDLPVRVRHVMCWHAILTLTDKPGQSGFPGGAVEADEVLAMLAIVFGGEDGIRDRPVAHCSVNVNSPLVYDRPMLESLLRFAHFGQPVLISPFVMAGVTGPATLAGTLAQQNAEVLAGVVLTQLVRPGVPVLYGAATSNVDLRNANPAIGSPESAISIAACAQLARHYGLPSRGGGALTDSPTPDLQSGYERMFTLLTSILSGVQYLMHGLGIVESYLAMSYAQFVIDLELLRMIRGFVGGVDLQEENLALETIHQVGPGGFFLDAPHTLERVRDAHFLPGIGLRDSFEAWLASGGPDVLQRATNRCRDLLASYSPPPMADSIRGELDAYVERKLAGKPPSSDFG